MFKGQTAWFSTSVRKKVRRLWVDNGGRLSDLSDAQFIFSQDTESTDTLSVFDSEAYLEEHLAVFHPNYIKECIKQGNTDQVILGKYFFPPADVQAIARDQLQYQWEMDGNKSDDDTTNSSDEEEPASSSKVFNKSKNVRRDKIDTRQASTSKRKGELNQSSEKKNGDKSMNGVDLGPTLDKQTYQGQSVGNVQADIRKQPERRSLRQSVRQMNNSTETVSHNTQRDSHEVHRELRHKSAEKNKTGLTSRDIVDGKTVKSFDTDYGSGNKVTPANGSGGMKRTKISQYLHQHEDIQASEILRLKDLAKVTGDLQDFIVGKNGCELVKI